MNKSIERSKLMYMNTRKIPQGLSHVLFTHIWGSKAGGSTGVSESTIQHFSAWKQPIKIADAECSCLGMAVSTFALPSHPPCQLLPTIGNPPTWAWGSLCQLHTYYHGLINYTDTKAKFHLKKFTCKGPLWQVFICLRPPSLPWPHAPLDNSDNHLPQGPFTGQFFCMTT